MEIRDVDRKKWNELACADKSQKQTLNCHGPARLFWTRQGMVEVHWQAELTVATGLPWPMNIYWPVFGNPFPTFVSLSFSYIQN